MNVARELRALADKLDKGNGRGWEYGGTPADFMNHGIWYNGEFVAEIKYDSTRYRHVANLIKEALIKLGKAPDRFGS